MIIEAQNIGSKLGTFQTTVHLIMYKLSYIVQLSEQYHDTVEYNQTDQGTSNRFTDDLFVYLTHQRPGIEPRTWKGYEVRVTNDYQHHKTAV